MKVELSFNIIYVYNILISHINKTKQNKTKQAKTDTFLYQLLRKIVVSSFHHHPIDFVFAYFV